MHSMSYSRVIRVSSAPPNRNNSIRIISSQRICNKLSSVNNILISLKVLISSARQGILSYTHSNPTITTHLQLNHSTNNIQHVTTYLLSTTYCLLRLLLTYYLLSLPPYSFHSSLHAPLFLTSYSLPICILLTVYLGA